MKDKDYKKLEQIGESLAVLQESRESMEVLAEQSNAWIDEAVALQDENLVNSLIQDKFEILQLARDLKFLEIEVTQIALTAKSLSALKQLPAALSNCCKLLSSTPNLKKLGAQIGKQKSELEAARKKLRDIRSSIVGDAKKKVNANPFAKDNSQGALSSELEKFMANEKRASETRLEEKVRKTVPMPVATEKAVGGTVSAAASAGTSTDGANIDALIDMLNSENKKN